MIIVIYISSGKYCVGKYSSVDDIKLNWKHKTQAICKYDASKSLFKMLKTRFCNLGDFLSKSEIEEMYGVEIKFLDCPEYMK